MDNTSGNAPANAGYGFSEHVANESTFVFGLNAGNVRLAKFEHTMHGGKDGGDLEAMDILFTIDGKDRGYRKFPISRAYVNDPATKQQVEVTDPAHPAIAAEKQLLSQVLTHIVGCFVEKSDISTALNANPIQSFKHFCTILQDLLPVDFMNKPLDGFGVWQWQIGGEAKNTYLEFPKNMKHGRWIQASIPPVGKWEKQQNPAASLSEVALRYVDADGNKHPFSRNGWFMESNFAAQQKEAQSSQGTAMQAGAGASSGGDW
jgi:hypothetical protein